MNPYIQNISKKPNLIFIQKISILNFLKRMDLGLKEIREKTDHLKYPQFQLFLQGLFLINFLTI
jgi:hypothetical protein